MMRMIPPTSSAIEIGLFMILMATGQDQDARNDLRPLWGVTRQGVLCLQDSNLLWMAAGRDVRITPCACSRWMNSPMVRVECPMVNTVSGHFVRVSFRDGCASCLSEAGSRRNSTPSPRSSMLKSETSG
jgi:hypothetical protein